MKKYILLTIKKYIPFLIVGFVLTFFLLTTTALTTITTKTISNNYFNGEDFALDVYPILIISAVPMFLLTCIGPLFANSYRNSLESADLYYQFGKEKRYIRYVHNLVILGMILAILIVSYSSALFLMLYRQLPNIGKEPVNNGNYTLYYIVYNYGYLIIVFLLYLIFAVINYAISYFLVTRANNAINSILTLILGHFILLVGIETPLLYGVFHQLINSIQGDSTIFYNPLFLIFTRSVSVISFVSWIVYIFAEPIAGVKSTFLNNFSEMKSFDVVALVFTIVSLILFIGLAIISILAFFIEKETSGEYSGKAVGRGNLQYIIFNVGFGIIGLIAGCGYYFVGSLGIGYLQWIPYFLLVTGMASFGAVYYVLTGLLRRNFKLKKGGLAILFGSTGTNVVLALIFIIIASV